MTETLSQIINYKKVKNMSIEMKRNDGFFFSGWLLKFVCTDLVLSQLQHVALFFFCGVFFVCVVWHNVQRP